MSSAAWNPRELARRLESYEARLDAYRHIHCARCDAEGPSEQCPACGGLSRQVLLNGVY